MFVSGETLNFSGVLTSHGNSRLHQGNYGSGGAGGSQGPAGGYGRVAVYYQNSISVHGAPTAYIALMGGGTPVTPTPTGTPIIPTSQPPVSGWTPTNYTYTAAHPHAATAAGVNTYTYDENGNMTCRAEGGKVYVQHFNVENRLSGIDLVDGTCETPGNILSTWLFAYDGDGVRVSQGYTSGGSTLTTLYFMAGMYETTVETGAVKKYYAISGMTVAFNDGSGLKYLLTDHLGSVIAVTDAQGALVQQQRYMPLVTGSHAARFH